MSKKSSDNQTAGDFGEVEFQRWATLMGWHPGKIVPDHGLDFLCQVPGARAGSKSMEMPGLLLTASVRSTSSHAKSVKITRSDAQLLFSTNTPMVFALVRRGDDGGLGEVAIRFPDETFIRELDSFLRSGKQYHQLRFDEAVTDKCKIEYDARRLFNESHAERRTRLLAELRIAHLLPEPHVEIVLSETGSCAVVKSSAFRVEHNYTVPPGVQAVLTDLGFSVIHYLPPDQSHMSTSVGPEEHVLHQSVVSISSAIIPSEQRGSDICGHVSLEAERRKIPGHDVEPAPVFERIRNYLSVWDNGAALDLAEQVLQGLKSHGSLSSAELILLARVYIARGEDRGGEDEGLERAEHLLDQASRESHNEDAGSEIRALRASLIYLRDGLDTALVALKDDYSPYATRTKAALLLNHGKLAEGHAVIASLAPHERWCDVAVAIHAQLGNFDDALRFVKWSSELRDRSRHLQCSVKLAEATLLRVYGLNGEAAHSSVTELSPEALRQLDACLDALKPAISASLLGGCPTSQLDVCVLRLVWQICFFMQQFSPAADMLRLLNAWTPVPLDVARGVLNGVMAAPVDLPERLLRDHPDDFEAGLLAVTVLCACQEKHAEAFAIANKLQPLADDPERAQNMFKLFVQCWVGLEGEERNKCEALIRSRATKGEKLLSVFEAAVLLRNGNPTGCLRKLDRNNCEQDVFALQVRAQALHALKHEKEAVSVLMSLAKRMPTEATLRKTVGLAYQARELDAAVWCLEQLAERYPADVGVRGNLAQIYAFDRPDPEKAATQFRALHAAEPGDTVHAFNLAVSLAQSYRPVESLQVYDKLCAGAEPTLQVILGRAQLLHCLGRPEDGLRSLVAFKERFGDDPSFIMPLMFLAHAAGDETTAGEALMRLISLQKDGKVRPESFTPLTREDGVKTFLERAEQVRERTQHLQGEMLKGKMPWTWAAAFSDTPFYAAWRMRTHETGWVGDEPVNRSQYCIYATNGFHPGKSQSGQRQLLPLECPPAGAKVVADISALITLHRLDLLDAAATQFGEILVPAAYLPTVLDDSRQMVIAQRAQRDAAERILQKISKGDIELHDGAVPADLAQVDEYYEGSEQRYRLIDLVTPMYDAGVVSDAQFNAFRPVCKRDSGISDGHGGLERFQAIAIAPITLRTLAGHSLLDSAACFFRVTLPRETQRECQITLEQFANQEETRLQHLDLWGRLRGDARFRFVPVEVPEGFLNTKTDPKNYLPFLSCFLARDAVLPLLADDRVCQVFALNDRPDGHAQAFGTDVLTVALLEAGKLDTSRVGAVMRQLMKWRYRFIVPPVKILKHFADAYCDHPPGVELREVAVYAHDCMRDPGLFSGAEPTDMGDSMAMRLYLRWLSAVAELIMLVWMDKVFSTDAATRFTNWAVRELQPSVPLGLTGLAKIKAASLTNRLLLSRALLATWPVAGEPRMADALSAIKEALQITDGEYALLVMETLNDTARTAAKA